ncbi:ADP-ribosyltransferase [uncultured Clostridium sp.]|uniref:ADP-ribosyltransferase n=1 Tax=uncultured Clostridium sp. TaxID=59620 RepID=UPI0028E5DB33|nr:ADP-ribosyltransferase [uncultured Clostridium sp.]
MINKLLDDMKYGKIENTINVADYIEFKEEKAAEAWGIKYYSEWAEKHKESMKIAKEIIKTPLATSSIECYCGYNYRQINEYLRFNVTPDDDNIYREMSDILAISLSMAPRVPDNVIVYRLVCDEFIRELIQNNKEGIPKIEQAFISTSLTEKIVESSEFYSDHENMLKIYVKANTVGIYVNVITARSENELLLYPNGYFKLLKKPYRANNKNIYECELFYFK